MFKSGLQHYSDICQSSLFILVIPFNIINMISIIKQKTVQCPEEYTYQIMAPWILPELDSLKEVCGQILSRSVICFFQLIIYSLRTLIFVFLIQMLLNKYKPLRKLFLRQKRFVFKDVI